MSRAMWEIFEMDDGTEVKFYSRLTFNGIVVEVNKDALEAEKRDEFRRQISSERDVVKIQYV